MAREDTLRKLEKLMERLIIYSESNYKLTILKGEDRRAYKKDLKFVDHAIKLIKGDYVPDFSKENFRRLNKVWKKYKPNEPVYVDIDPVRGPGL